jgi:thiol-disulfide isomerase/thioredoxin
MLRQCLLGLSVVVVGFVGCNQHPASPPAAKQVAIAPGEIGSNLPEFTVKDLQGRFLSSADLHGKVLLVDFWATWCQPCKKEMPGYQKLLDHYGARGFAVIGFKSEVMRDAEDPAQFARKIGVHYPLAVASDDLNQEFGGIQGLPTTMLYDRHGILRMKIIGFEYTDTVESNLKPLL